MCIILPVCAVRHQCFYTQSFPSAASRRRVETACREQQMKQAQETMVKYCAIRVSRDLRMMKNKRKTQERRAKVVYKVTEMMAMARRITTAGLLSIFHSQKHNDNNDTNGNENRRKRHSNPVSSSTITMSALPNSPASSLPIASVPDFDTLMKSCIAMHQEDVTRSVAAYCTFGDLIDDNSNIDN